MGLTPLWSFHNIIVLFLVLVIRTNLSGFLGSFALFSGFAYALDGVFIQFGEYLLSHAALIDLWTGFYNSDFWRITHFNNTLTLGSLLIAMMLAIPFYFAGLFIIVNYREHIMAWVMKTKLAQVVRASKFYKLFVAADLGGMA